MAFETGEHEAINDILHNQWTGTPRLPPGTFPFAFGLWTRGTTGRSIPRLAATLLVQKMILFLSFWLAILLSSRCLFRLFTTLGRVSRSFLRRVRFAIHRDFSAITPQIRQFLPSSGTSVIELNPYIILTMIHGLKTV